MEYSIPIPRGKFGMEWNLEYSMWNRLGHHTVFMMWVGLSITLSNTWASLRYLLTPNLSYLTNCARPLLQFSPSEGNNQHAFLKSNAFSSPLISLKSSPGSRPANQTAADPVKVPTRFFPKSACFLPKKCNASSSPGMPNLSEKCWVIAD